MPNGRETSFPWQEIRGQLVFDSFFFSDNQKYQKFQNAVALKFNTVLPDPESHTPRNLPT
jgi:hypothetical protein